MATTPRQGVRTVRTVSAARSPEKDLWQSIRNSRPYSALVATGRPQGVLSASSQPVRSHSPLRDDVFGNAALGARSPASGVSRHTVAGSSELVTDKRTPPLVMNQRSLAQSPPSLYRRQGSRSSLNTPSNNSMDVRPGAQNPIPSPSPSWRRTLSPKPAMRLSRGVVPDSLQKVPLRGSPGSNQSPWMHSEAKAKSYTISPGVAVNSTVLQPSPGIKTASQQSLDTPNSLGPGAMVVGKTQGSLSGAMQVQGTHALILGGLPCGGPSKVPALGGDATDASERSIEMPSTAPAPRETSVLTTGLAFRIQALPESRVRSVAVVSAAPSTYMAPGSQVAFSNGSKQALHAPAPDALPLSQSLEDSASNLQELSQLALVLRNPSLLQSYATSLFRRSDTNRDGVLSMAELENLIAELHKDLGLSLAESPTHRNDAVRARMRRYDVNGDGVLDEAEFFELYRWTLWCKYEALDPPAFKRGDLIGGMHKGTPNQFYIINDKIGEGMFGVVHKVVQREQFGASERVMKTISKHRAVQSGTPLALLQQEIDILALLDHPHILRMFEHYNDTQNVYLITDVCNGGDLLEIVEAHAEARKPLPEPWIATVFRQSLEAVGYCHTKGVMHKDLKFENLMLRFPVTCDSPIEDVHMVLIDVGLAELFGPQHAKGSRSNILAGSLATMAPEVIVRDFSYKCDIWSFGCLLFVIFNVVPHYLPDGKGGRVLYTYPFAPEPSETDPFGIEALAQAQRAGPPMEQIQAASPEAQELIRSMLAYDEGERPGAQECLAKPWICKSPSVSATLSEEQVQTLIKDREITFWRRAATLEAATQLPASAVTGLADEFQALSSKSAGFIGTDVLAQALQNRGVATDIANKAAAAADMDNSGRIEWSEFIAAMLPASHELFATALQAAFQEFDTNHDGFLDREEVGHLLQSGHIGTTHMPVTRTVDMMIAELDTDRDGRVSFAEFHDYLLNADGAAPTIAAQ